MATVPPFRRMARWRVARCRTARLAATATAVLVASCARSTESARVRSFLEAVQSPFDLGDRTLLGVPVQPLAHLVVAAILVAALAWWWRPRAAGVLAGVLIAGKEVVDLSIIALYQPVTWTYASDSVWDIGLSLVGGAVGLWAALRARRRVGGAATPWSTPPPPSPKRSP